MGYSNDPAMVQVDFFKSSGKWYTTETVKWVGKYSDPDIQKSFLKSLREHFKESPERLSEMDAVCHIHKDAPPLCIRSGGWMNNKGER